MPTLATRFGRNRVEFRSDRSLTEDQIRRYAPSIFAEQPHDSRSTRYTYIPTSQVLSGLRREGFEPFQVAQSRTRAEDRREYTKHMIRLRHASQIEAREEANEVILINSHDGTSSYQMLAGNFRFVCCNGLIVGEQVADIRIPHKGDVQGLVIEGAYRVLEDFQRVSGSIEDMKQARLSQDEQLAFTRAALELRYDEGKSPIDEHRANEPQRRADAGDDLWRTFNRVQENLVRGGQTTWDSRRQRRVTTRQIAGIDQNVKLNRALWVLAEEMKKLRMH